MRVLSLVAAIGLAGALVTVAQRNQPPSDDAGLMKSFVGMWRLVSWPERLSDGTTKQNPEGAAYLIYTNSGHMCFVAMNPKRPKWKSQTSPTAEEMASALSNDGFYAYCGKVEVHAKEGFVVHHIEIDKVPNLVGTTRKRWFKFEGPNRLSLRIDSPAAPVVESTLVWERVQETGE
jgi:hypothetical protein